MSTFPIKKCNYLYKLRLPFALYPIGVGEAGDSLKDSAEGAVTLVTAPFCQSKHGDRTVSLSCFTIETDKVVNAQLVNVVVIGCSLFCKITTLRSAYTL